MNRAEITQFANNDPQFSKAVDMMEEQLAQQPIVPEDMDEFIFFLEKILEDPSRYAEILNAAIADGEIEAGMFPAQFDMTFVVSLLVALYGIQDRMSQRGYSRGGLKVAARRIAAEGRNGDTVLAHINPGEAQMLKIMGGSGSINPETGLPEFFSIGKLFAAILPIALSFILPGIGTAIGGAISSGLGLGLSAAGSLALGTGVIGFGSSLLGGAKPFDALISGVGAGGMSLLGGALGFGDPAGGGLGLGGAAASTGVDTTSGFSIPDDAGGDSALVVPQRAPGWILLVAFLFPMLLGKTQPPPKLIGWRNWHPWVYLLRRLCQAAPLPTLRHRTLQISVQCWVLIGLEQKKLPPKKTFL